MLSFSLCSTPVLDSPSSKGTVLRNIKETFPLFSFHAFILFFIFLPYTCAVTTDGKFNYFEMTLQFF